MIRMRLRTALTAIAALAVILGAAGAVRRRADRLDQLSHSYSREAGRLESQLIGPSGTSRDGPGPEQASAILAKVHWCDAVANEYKKAAARPWYPFDPDPSQVVSQ